MNLLERKSLNFADRLEDAIEQKKSCLVVGLDPLVDTLPAEIHGRVGGALGNVGWTARAAAAVGLFLNEVIDLVAPHAVAVKPNVAFFERLGPVGWDCLCRVSQKAQKSGLLIITDAKRGDIGHSAEAYAEALLGDIPDTLGPVTDAVTVNPFLGTDGLKPFLERVERGGKGIFVLVRTSNPSAGEIQDLDVSGQPLYEHVARLVRSWGEGLEGACGLSPVGAVVGATAPTQGKRVRQVLGKSFLLVPGLGAQGGRAEALAPLFLPGGRGVLVSASRSILNAHQSQKGPWQSAVEAAALEAKKQLDEIRRG